MRPRARVALEASSAAVSTRCDGLDAVLRGGVRTRQLTEIVGESGSAKTILCCQLALAAQIDLGCAVVYVHTEGPAPTAIMHRVASSKRMATAFGSEEAAREALERVYVVKALSDPESLRETLGSLSAVLAHPVDANASVRMIVVDSVAAPFRDDECGASAGWSYAARRAGALHKLTMVLKEYASVHDLAVVVTNHVVDSMRERGAVGDDANATRSMGEFTSSGRRVVPALGLMWANCVNTRLFLTRHAKRRTNSVIDAGDKTDGASSDPVARRFHVVYAPHLPAASADFRIDADGVWDD